MAGIASWGSAIPTWRLERAMLAKAWDTPAMPGERAVAAGDQDALTLAAEAALAATPDPSVIDAVFFASTTSPYAEKHAAATIAAVLDRHDVRTTDITGTLRAGTTALRAALDAVRSGGARAALVAAADLRPAEPATAAEQLYGDGAAAFVVTNDGPVTVLGEASFAEEAIGAWRQADDPYVRGFDAKFETEYGYARLIERAATDALKAADLTADSIARLAIYAPDPRTHATTAKRLGIASKDPLFATVGNLGAAHAMVALASALEEAKAGDHVLVAATGEGADALVVQVGDGARAPARTVAEQVAHKRVLPSYERYVRFRRLIPWDEQDTPSSTIRTWRDRAQAFALWGVRCTACGMVQFPANRGCVVCSAMDRMEPQRLARAGTVFTFTLDHLIAGEYLETPVPRAVVDLDGGGRVFVEVTDCEPSDVAVGMRVELTFRLMHEGAGFRNYYWKGRPAWQA